MENIRMIKAFLATDDPRVAETVTRVVQNCCPQVTLVASADEGTE